MHVAASLCTFTWEQAPLSSMLLTSEKVSVGLHCTLFSKNALLFLTIAIPCFDLPNFCFCLKPERINHFIYPGTEELPPEAASSEELQYAEVVFNNGLRLYKHF